MTFASKLLNESATLYEQTTTLLKEKHREVYNIIHQKESNDSNESTVPTANGDESLNEPTEELGIYQPKMRRADIEQVS